MSFDISDKVAVSSGDQEIKDVFVFVGCFLHKLGKAVRLNKIEELGSGGVFQVI